MYFPAMYVIDEWFIARKGLAFAIIWTGTGVGGAIFPFVSQWLLDTYGFRTALRVWAVVIVSRVVIISLELADNSCRLSSLCHQSSL
jgi:MFS family permease